MHLPPSPRRLRAAALALALALPLLLPQPLSAQRTETLLTQGWRFHPGEAAGAEAEHYADSAWQQVCVPHDWAITQPFCREADLQRVAVEQNFEREASVKTGRTGGLPYAGVLWYRLTLPALPPGAGEVRQQLVFDGAMSEAQVWVNGCRVGEWPYGYSSFHFDITPWAHRDGRPDVLAVRLCNRSQSSRWYPGAGLYRNVRLVRTRPAHFSTWGINVQTERLSRDSALVLLDFDIEGVGDRPFELLTELTAPDMPSGTPPACRGRACPARQAGKPCAHCPKSGDGQCGIRHSYTLPRGEAPARRHVRQRLVVCHPQPWSPERPALYSATCRLRVQGQTQDSVTLRFGLRTVELDSLRGFLLNGEARKFRGVCLHHDLGPLGAAVSRDALRHQLLLLREMGADAVRTTHNPPAPEQVELCDELGLMMLLEPFDEWDVAKCDSGYHRFFGQWCERDLGNMLLRYRSHPSVVMWSVGNEVPTQTAPRGTQVARRLTDLCHRLDPTRPVTCGMDRVQQVLDNGFATVFDVPGLNYRTHLYQEAHDKLPQRLVLGSETASTVSSRGVYKFPPQPRAGALYDDHQSSGYDLEYCSWSNLPDVDLALQQDHPWTIGQFVWTGFDYLGEPTPYDTDAWPSHSSLFGIFDLASLPKDRYWLYRSVWRPERPTLHILPHWTWPGREGKLTPVYVYTNQPEAELFLNGRSLGRRRKLSAAVATRPEQRYRLMWDSVRYQSGELRAVAYDAQGLARDTATVRTAGAPHRLELQQASSGGELVYLTLSALDSAGTLCPDFNALVEFSVEGPARFRAAANGDPTCLLPFQQPRMQAFHGQLTLIVQTSGSARQARVRATAPGMEPAVLTLR